MVVAAVWVVLLMGWYRCGFVGLVGCRRSAGWFGGWWAGLVGFVGVAFGMGGWEWVVVGVNGWLLMM